MSINEQNIKNISIDEFKKLLDSIGVASLRKNLLESSKTFPTASIYYTSRRGDGAFWNGFRKETFPKNRIDSFYIDEVYLYKSKLNVYENFEKLIKKKFKIDDENLSLEEIEEIEIKVILSKIFELKIDQDDLNKSLLKQLEESKNKEITKIKEEFEEKIRKIIDKKDIEGREECSALEKKYKSIIQELELSILKKDEQIKKLLTYETKVKKILDEIKIQDDLEEIILNKQMTNSFEIKKVLIDGFNEIIDAIENDEDIGKSIVKQYIIYKLIKE